MVKCLKIFENEWIQQVLNWSKETFKRLLQSISISYVFCSFQLSKHKIILKAMVFTKTLISTTVFNIDNNIKKIIEQQINILQ